MKIRNYDYPNDVMETVKINKKIRNDFRDFCKRNKIIKSRLIEEFYKRILVEFKSGNLNPPDTHISIDILRGTICQSQ